MAGTLVDKGEERALAFLVNKAGYTVRNLILRLFKNDVTPAEEDVIGTYVEATFPGYAAITLLDADWSFVGEVNVETGATNTGAVTAQKSFTCSGGPAELIYGYYLTTETDGELVLAKRFSGTGGPAGPFSVEQAGDIVNVTLHILQD